MSDCANNHAGPSRGPGSGRRERGRERERGERVESGINEGWKSICDGLSRRNGKRKYSEMDRWRKCELA